MGAFYPPKHVWVSAPWAEGLNAAEILKRCSKKEMGGHPWIYEAWYNFIQGVIYEDKALRPKGMREPPASTPADIPLHAKLHVSLSTTNRMEHYKHLEGAWPGNFFYLYRALEGRTWVPFYSTGQDRNKLDIGEITAHYAHKGASHGETRIIDPFTLGEVLFGAGASGEWLLKKSVYFEHENAKASNGRESGVQHRKALSVSRLIYMGKEVHSLSDGVDDMPDELAEEVGEGLNIYEHSLSFGGSVLTGMDIREMSVSIDEQLRVLRRKLSVGVIAGIIGTTRDDVYEMSKKSIEPNWITAKRFAQFRQVRDELFRRAGIDPGELLDEAARLKGECDSILAEFCKMPEQQAHEFFANLNREYSKLILSPEPTLSPSLSPEPVLSHQHVP